MVELFLIRHGETDSNDKNLYTGWTNVPLNSTGKNQALNLKKLLEKEHIDFIYSSPLRRALFTAEIINSDRHLDIVESDLLKEFNFGIFENMTYKEIIKRYPDIFKLWTAYPSYKIHNGDSFRDFHKRISNFLNDFLLKHNSGRILIVSHGGTIRSIISYLLNLKPEDSWKFKVKLGSLNKLLISNSSIPCIELLNYTKLY
ncbi:MAG: alpha-ribazole phosphatase [Clostridiales bacterium]